MALHYVTGMKVRPKSRMEIRSATSEFRSFVEYHQGSPLTLPFDVTRILEVLEYKGVISYHIAEPQELMDRTNMAEFDPFNNIITIREDVYDKACDGSGRDRLTIAHEFGHYWMHRDQLKFGRASNEHHERFEDSEWQADCFAGEFLFPFDALLHLDPRYSLTATLQMSHQAVMTQLNAFRKERGLDWATQQKIESLIRGMDEASDRHRFGNR